MVKREFDGKRPSEQRIKDGGSRGGYLPPLLGAHRRRNELKMAFHVGSYDGKGDPDNYLHLFEGAIRMQNWAMPVACHMFTYSLKDCSNMVEWTKSRFSKGFSWDNNKGKKKNQYRFSKGFSWDNNKGKKKNQYRFSSYNGSNHGLLTNLSKSPREILAMEKELRHHIKEAVKSGQLAHLVKGIKKGKAKASDTQLDEWKKRDKDIVLVEALILMMSRSPASKRKLVRELINGIGEITFLSVLGSDNSSDLVIIRAQIYKKASQLDHSGWILKFHSLASRERIPGLSERSPGNHHRGKSPHKDRNPEFCHRQLEAYTDDMVIKSAFEEDMLMDIQETFDRLRSINIKLNPKKCSFDVEEGEAFGLRPYHFTYLERRLTMEEMLYKFIDEGKREHEEMRAFICEFQTTNELLFKERNNSLSELRFEVQELLKVIDNTPMTNCEIKGVTTRGGKTMTHDVQTNNTNVHAEEPLVVDHDKPVESNEVLDKDQPQTSNEPVTQL
nr:reverse transcriptase domain-containing protein [Tanacetum cinerariifolium]